MVSFEQGFHQLVKNRHVGVGIIETEDCQVSSAFKCLPHQLGDTSCMLDSAFPHRGVDVGVPQEERQAMILKNFFPSTPQKLKTTYDTPLGPFA